LVALPQPASLANSIGWKEDVTMGRFIAFCSLPLGLTACSGSPPPPAAALPQAPEVAATEVHGEEVLVRHPEKSPARSNVNISDQIREKCGLSDTEAYFAFDSAKVTPQADRLLEAHARSFSSGPLSGESRRLVGHADPRGEESYNLVLGGQRAERVSLALAHKGVSAEHMASTSRGAMDAKGVDEAGWEKDRRVDVMLAD
jgi:peptidoglycan-associated lipoprotein